MLEPESDSAGIVSAGMYLPAQILAAEEIANLSGREEWVIREKISIYEKRIAGSDVHPNQTADWIPQDYLSKCELNPKEVNVILCTTDEREKYMLQNLGPSEARGIYNNTYSHLGEQDSISNIVGSEKQGRVKDRMICRKSLQNNK